jgi:DNA repair ATPase RecN
MSIHRASSAQRRIARQQLVHVLRSQLIRVQATCERQRLVIEAQERDLIDAAMAHGVTDWNNYVRQYHSAEQRAQEKRGVQRDAAGRFCRQ